MMTVQERLVAIEQNVVLIRLAVLGKQSEDAPSDIDSPQVLEVFQSMADNMANHLWWLRCALEKNNSMKVPAGTDDEKE